MPELPCIRAIYRVPSQGLPPEVARILEERFGARAGDLLVIQPDRDPPASFIRDFRGRDVHALGVIAPHLECVSGLAPAPRPTSGPGRAGAARRVRHLRPLD